MIVPPAAGKVPPEATQIYPAGVQFIARGLGLNQLTAEGYDGVIGRVSELAEELAAEGADAVALMGTSLSFYKGAAFNALLHRTLSNATGLPVTTMSTGIIDSLNALGIRNVAVATAYSDDVDTKLRKFLQETGFNVCSMKNLGLVEVEKVRAVGEEEIFKLGISAARTATNSPDGLLISCGGLATGNLVDRLEQATQLPVVTSATSGVWAAARLLSLSATGSKVLGQLSNI